MENWKSEGFDLWEEVKSNDFYFNRMAFVYSLNVAADFGDMIGRTEGEEYRTLAETIRVRPNTSNRLKVVDSIPKSVLRYLLNKVRYFSLETYLNPILFSQIKRLMDEIEFYTVSLV